MHKRALLVLITGLTMSPFAARAQCGLVAEMIAADCASAPGPVTTPESWMVVSITAGTPPFLVKTQQGNTLLSMPTIGSEYLWFLVNFHDPFTIEDGNGCVTANFPQDDPILLSPSPASWWIPTPFPECPMDQYCQVPNNDGGILYDPFTGYADVRITRGPPHAWEFGQVSNYTLTGPVNRSGIVGALPDGPIYAGSGCQCALPVLPDLPPGSYAFTATNNSLPTYLAPPGYPWQGLHIDDCSFGTPITVNFTVPTAPFTLGDDGVNVTPQIALNGAMPATGTLMNDNLRSSGLLPLTEPYSDLGYSFFPASTAGASIAQSLLNTTGNNAIVDWVIVEIRSEGPPFALLASRPALVQRDGDVVDLDGDQYVNFPGLSSGNYRVAIRHRNHLGIMSGSSSALGLIPTQVSLRASNAAVHGTNATTTVDGVRRMWPGDGNGSGEVRYTGAGNDRDQVLQAIGGIIPTNTITNVYDRNDINLDGSIQYTGANNDRDMILQAIGGVVPTGFRTQQLP